jgi:hypothetical protein
VNNPIEINAIPNSRGPTEAASMLSFFSSNSKNLYTVNPNVIIEAPVRTHAINVRS